MLAEEISHAPLYSTEAEINAQTLHLWDEFWKKVEMIAK